MTPKFKAGQLVKTIADKNWSCYDSCKVGCPGHDYYGSKIRKVDNKFHHRSCAIPHGTVVLVLGIGHDGSAAWRPPDFMNDPVEILIGEERVFVNAGFLEELEAE